MMQHIQYRSQVTLHSSASDTRVMITLLASRFACVREYVYEYSCVQVHTCSSAHECMRDA